MLKQRFICAARLLPFALVLLLTACDQPVDPPAREPGSYNPDLHQWKTASWTPFTLRDSVKGFAYGRINGGDVYVAVAATGVIGWSLDGDIWEHALRSDLQDEWFVPVASYNAVAYGGGYFVAVGGTGKIAYSADGKHWTEGPAVGINGFGSTNDINAIAWGDGRFVAVGANGNISYKLDLDIADTAKDWIWCGDNGGAGGANRFRFGPINDIVYSGGRFYIAGAGGHVGKAGPPFGPQNWGEYTYGGGTPINSQDITKIALGKYGTNPALAMIINSSWVAFIPAANFALTAFGIDADVDISKFNGQQLRGIAWGEKNAESPGCFVAAGVSAMIGYWYTDQYSDNTERYWRALSFREFSYWEITAAAAMNGRFYVGGIGGKIGYSK